MASPQLEDGYTTIANQILEALIKADLSGQEIRITLLIIRKTYGFKKTEDTVSLSQMVSLTGMSKTRCSQVVNRLQLQKILTVTENINGISKTYKFNKDFESWQTVTKKFNRYIKPKRTVTLFRNEPLHKSVTTKETITKENIQKKIYTPDFELFYQAYPKKVKKPGAFKEWKKLNGNRPDIQVVLKAIEEQKTWRSWMEGFIPDPERWIKNERWADEKPENTTETPWYER